MTENALAAPLATPRRDDLASKLMLIGTLYVSQAIPLGFFTVALPAILRARGFGLEQVGMVAALALPWLLKFLWAPLVDRFGSRRHGHFRSWILPLQTLAATTVVVIAFLDVERQLPLLVVAGALFMLLAATQDIATDGLAVRILRFAERGPGNGIQVGGYYLGHILGGGAMLFAFSRLGWQPALVLMAVALALPLLPAWRFHEPAAMAEPRERRLDYRALARFVRRAGGPWLAVLLLYRGGEALAMTMYNPMLVDLGLSLEEIGLLIGVAGAAAALAGALVGGFWVRRSGRRRALLLFAGLQAVALLLLALPALGYTATVVIYGVAMAVAFAGGMGTAALYTAMMDRSDRDTAATDFTLQQSLAAIGPLVLASISGYSAQNLGYALHFALAAALCLAALALVTRLAPATRHP